MPFLRRRGVMASETDMRRHTIIDPGTGSGSGAATLPSRQSVAPRKSLAESLLRPSSSKLNSRPSLEAAGEERDKFDNGEGSSTETNAFSAAMSVSAGRPSEDDPFSRPESPPIQEETPKHRRFSMLRFRNASDSQLSTRLKQQQQQQAEKPPPMPRRMSLFPVSTSWPLPHADLLRRCQLAHICTSASYYHNSANDRRRGRFEPEETPPQDTNAYAKIRGSPRTSQSQPEAKLNTSLKNDRRKSTAEVSDLYPSSTRPSNDNAPGKQTVTFQEPQQRPPSSRTISQTEPPAYGDENGSALALPVNRLSESERSEGSASDHGVYGSTTTTTTQTTSTTTFFRLPRRKQKQPESMFPMGHLPQKGKTPALQPTASSSSLAPRDSTSADTPRPSTGGRSRTATPVASPSQSSTFLGKPAASPATALFRPGSRNSGQSSPTRSHLTLRGRSSTMSSLGRASVEDRQFAGTTRTSSSTGRKSFGDLLGISRLRQNSDNPRHGALTPATPGSTSKNNSLQLTREKEPVVLPERREDDTPAKYLNRLEEVLSRGVIAAALSKGTDPFMAAVLRSYMRSFGFFEEPMDIAIRKLLMEAELPKETQQIDRFLQAFANRYHECNPGIYSTPDQAYFIAFSLLILHTDVFNKNNKYKMQKPDYLKNTRGEGIFDDVLECFYDNITYTPFIHVEDDFDVNGERLDPIDPYTIILDGKLDSLRPPLKDQIPLEEHFSYLGTAKALNVKELQKTFFRTGVLQIVSARSRPDAFMTEKTLSNPQEAHPGIVDIKITKVGILWRKDQKKKKARSPWQEWGAILTGAQLYFFRNTAWIKNLMHQYETHLKSGHDGSPLTFNPPLEQFKPDALMSTDGAVALWDMSYKKHKNSFVYVRHGGFEEVLLAQSEDDRNDWLAKLNYAAAFRTSGVRMRGLIGGNYEGQGRRAIRRLESSEVTQVIQTPTGEVSINRSRIDQKMAQDILVARREVMEQRIAEAEEKLQAAEKHLDSQLQNARHLIILAPIQEKTRDSVRGGAAKIIAQLKWSRTEIWRLKCHRDILQLDLQEDKDVNGDLSEFMVESTAPAEHPALSHKKSRASSKFSQQQSPGSPAPPIPAPANNSLEPESPMTDVFQTPPTSSSGLPMPHVQQPHDGVTLSPERPGMRKSSISSATSSHLAVGPSATRIPSHLSTDRERRKYEEHPEEDEGERHVLEQAGLLEIEPSHTPDHRPTSSLMTSDDTPERSKRSSAAVADKDKLERSKIRRSLQRTLREGAGHLSHHRGRKGKDSASSGGLADDTAREDILARSGSFTVHGKKASVIEFGSSLQNMTSEDRIRQRKQSVNDDPILSPASVDDDFHSIIEVEAPVHGSKERRSSAASASTATARSFRELHRKYSTHRGLTVPSDEDSDAALSFSEGRRSPLPPVEDGSADEEEDEEEEERAQAQFYTPEPPSSPVDETDEEKQADPSDKNGAVERLPSPPIQAVRA
ncbi:hypothetical protein PG997_012444 [Apiospora hydei]|uniref:Protein transport protein sec73 n=1 Tax=Apiospora hydei TaxID=1337664 RepID=A0ABR1V3G1_9PEZI